MPWWVHSAGALLTTNAVMVLTVLEARVQPDRVPDLLRAFEETKSSAVPPFIVRSFLLRSDQDPDVWRIMTIFRSPEDLDAMRASGQTPRAVAMFRAAGAEPTFSRFTIADQLEYPNLSQVDYQ
jgi:hypothetical protein